MFTMPSPDDRLNSKQAGEYLHISDKTLAVWRCTKRYPLPYYKVGRLVQYKRSDLDAFIEAGRTERRYD